MTAWPSVNTPTTLPDVAKVAMVMRSIRVPLRLWNEAKDIADELGLDISGVVRLLLERFIRDRHV